MSTSRLEIKIIKDVDDKDIDMKAMSLQAAQSFLLLFESITKIVELTPDNKAIKIQITSGSLVAAAEGEPVVRVKKEFDKILQSKSSNRELVEQWRRIQTVFCANGLQYEANFYDKGQSISIYQSLRNHQKLRSKPVIAKKFKTELEFLTGKLIAVGGKNPNIHVEIDGKAIPPISCTELNASKAKAYLYQTIRFSAWSKATAGNKKFTLCDSYHNDEIFTELHEAFSELFHTDQVNALKKLHYRCRQYLDDQEYGKLRKFLRLFIHESTDINMLKTILILMQSVKEIDQLKPSFSNIQEVFLKKFKMLNKKTNRQ